MTVPFDGDITFSALIGDSAPDSVVIRDSNGDIVGADADSNDPDGTFDGVRTVNDLGSGTYTVIVFDGALRGAFSVAVECSSDSPTAAPTMEPTPSPTNPLTIVSCGDEVC